MTGSNVFRNANNGKRSSIVSEVVSWAVIALMFFGCSCLFLSTLAGVACGPAAHQAPSSVVGHPALLTSRVDLSETSWAGSTHTQGVIK